jgi:exopolyphosphatase / guanosine-5'-triphosphate,3'-diphosphate pyrophosphatase
MPENIPRWEWRTFGQCFGQAQTRLAELVPDGIQESDEIYLLSGGGDNVKIRDALVDIKVLQEVNADGLEQWAPAMKARFPLLPTEVARVFEALRLPAPSLSRASYTFDELMRELGLPSGAIRAVKVHKRRARYTFDGCLVELADVLANGKSTRTIAVESEDAAGVIRTVQALGLGSCVNTSYPRGLRALVDDEHGRGG